MSKRPISSIRSPSSFVTFHLAKLQNSLNAQATALLKSRSDLTLVEWRVIQILRMKKGDTPSDIADVVQMDKGQLSRKIKTMVQKGLLNLQIDEKDQRVQHVHLTDKAKKLSRAMMPIMEKRQKILLADVSADELDTFYKVVDKLEVASKIRSIE